MISFFLLCVSAAGSAPCAAEKIFCKDGTVVEGDIVRFENGEVWVGRESGVRKIGIKRIDTILNADGTLSRYDSKNLIKRVMEYIREQKYAEAKSFCEPLIDYLDGNPRVLYLRAVLNQKTGDTEGAIRDYQLLLETGGADPAAYNNLGSIYAGRKEFSRAVELYKKALEKDPAFVQGHNNLADVYMQTGDDERAFEEYLAVAALEPGNARVLYNIGVLYLRKKNVSQARESWEKAVSLDPDYPEAKNALNELNDRNIS